MGTRIELSFRDLAILRAVDGGHAELLVGVEPDLYLDGRCCADQVAARRLARPVSSSRPFPVRPRTRCRHASPPMDGSRPSEPEPVSAENGVTASDQRLRRVDLQHPHPGPARHDRPLWPCDSST
jgi:hypothetical protein